MYRLNLHWRQVTLLEIWDIEYKLIKRNTDRATFLVSFETEHEYAKAIQVLIRG